MLATVDAASRDLNVGLLGHGRREPKTVARVMEVSDMTQRFAVASLYRGCSASAGNRQLPLGGRQEDADLMRSDVGGKPVGRLKVLVVDDN